MGRMLDLYRLPALRIQNFTDVSADKYKHLAEAYAVRNDRR